MRLAILYTSHRQWAELDYLPAFFERASRLKHQVDILFHCNNGQIDEAALRDKLAKIPARSVTVRVSPSKNTGGYVYGQYEAMADMWDHVDFSQWDWVIHMHPDLFIADETKLFGVIDQAERAGAELIVSAVFGHRLPSFGTDCFIFKPVPAVRGVFDGYIPLLSTPIRIPTENLFFIEVHRARLKYLVVPRYAHGHYHKDIDRWGIWHEHNLRRVAAYLQKPSSRWRFTLQQALRHPYQAANAVAVWLGRIVYGIPQDGLGAQLSRIESPK